MQQLEPRDLLITEFIEKHKLPESFNETALEWYIPLASVIFTHFYGAQKPFFLGLNGCQGSGKSTLSDFLKDYFVDICGLNVISLSIDDFYYSQKQREVLATQVHPLLKTRGVPGTHDCDMLKHVISSLKNNQFPISIPRFNKATDNPYPADQWQILENPIDIVIVEGWCWGVTAQSEQQLKEPVNDLEATEDEFGEWRRFVNTRVTQDYEPLYDYINYWVMLKAPSFKNVLAWRQEQERKLGDALKANPTSSSFKGLMQPNEIERFISHYQRLTEHGLMTLPPSCDCVMSLDKNRTISSNSISNEQGF